MATVAESLFGVTPESLMASREQRLQEQAMQFGRMTPIQAARAGFYEAGSRLGSGIGGLLGAQDPELMRVRQRQELLQGVDIADPTALRQAATVALQNGDNAAAQELARRALDIEKTQAGIAKDVAAAGASTAAAQASLSGKTPESIQVANLRSGLVGAIRTLKSQEQTPEVQQSLQFYQDRLDALPPLKQQPTQVVGVAKGSEVPVYEDDKGQFTYVKGPDGKQTRQPYYGAVDRTTAKVSATAVTQGEGAFATEFGKGLAQKDLALKDVAEAAPSALEGVTLTRGLLDSGRIFTGTGAGLKLNVLALGQALGVTGANADEIVANTQQLQQQRSKAVLNQIKTSGLGAGQGFTDKDLAFLQDASAGRITLSEETLRRQLNLEEKAFKASAKKWNDRLKTFDPQLARSMGLSEVQIEAAPAGGAPNKSPTPTKRFNPATGQIEKM
jgi:hypothetical protein